MTAEPRAAVVTIGAFDGVHLGHQALLREVADRARYLGVESWCVTFHPHPDVIIYPERHLTYLTDRDEKVALIEGLGIDAVRVFEFTRELSMLHPEEFIHLLRDERKLVELWVGPDFAMGRGRTGTVAALSEIAREEGFALHVVPPFRRDHEVVSSTYVRSLLAQGDVRHAADLLGRPYALSGVVEAGAGRGATLGFPTANIRPPAQLTLPADGVYAVRVRHDGSQWPGVANLGGRPTFHEEERLIEAHLLDFNGDLRGLTLAVEFHERIRSVRAFPNVEALVAQIAADAEQARRWFER